MIQNNKVRNKSIDFLRGIACIFIILIHTTWYSGTEYLPQWFCNMFLLIDVPVFIFLSGLSYRYVNSITKNIKGILKQWNKWVFFLLFYILILFIFFRTDFKRSDLLGYLFYKVTDKGPLCVVGGSVWFLLMYIKVTIFCSILLYFYNKYKDFDFKYILLIVFLLSGSDILFLDSFMGVYSFIYLLGYWSYDNKIKSLKKAFVIEILSILFAITSFVITKHSITDIQSLKFPPTIYYLIVSIPSIIIVWYLKDKLVNIKSKLFDYVGKNSIFFFY